MKSTTCLTSAGLVALTNAFPSLLKEVSPDAPLLIGRQQAPDLSTRFNAKEQYVSTSGEHAFVAPQGDDQRGPCPGLNAMANHGYLPHNGVGTHLDFITGTFNAFGMSADLSGFLTVLGGTVDGNGLMWSIGGPTKNVPSLPLLGTPQGISGSHNKYEADASPGRGDLYQYGDDFTLQMSQYQELYDMAIANGDNIDLDLMNDFRSRRFDQSIANNPYFFNGPFTGVLVQPAAYQFIFRFMGNKSEEHPQGQLNTDILNSFFGVEMVNGELTKIGGGGFERFPENWYKRAIGDEYSIPFLNSDTALAGLKYPKFLSVGGNLGKANTFTGVNPSDLTGGVYNAQMLSQGNNAMCFGSQFLAQAMPDMIKCSGVLGDLTGSLSSFTSAFNTAFGGLNCPQLEKIDNDQFKKFPGYTNLDCKTGKYN
ncbi:Putative chloroperoxidase [Septoria linicola]|uniref:Chloroperoxidase n=1 Tax=Septoria linicola TaxID=215465 RepID=A0A9Q9AMY0_9PEZI|nr:putative chloroperoxidase [Septoria linicola]USW51920.1 Putative chloroperoxidase [Septoria linicola]